MRKWECTEGDTHTCLASSSLICLQLDRKLCGFGLWRVQLLSFFPDSVSSNPVSQPVEKLNTYIHRDVLCTVQCIPLFSLWDWAVKLPYTLLFQHDNAVMSKWYSQCSPLDSWAVLPPCGHVLNCFQVWCILGNLLFHCIYLLTTLSVYVVSVCML